MEDTRFRLLGNELNVSSHGDTARYEDGEVVGMFPLWF